MKKIIIFIFIFIAWFLVSIYPSFVTRPGEDCLAGCSIGRGFPLPYKISYAGGILGIPAVADDINKTSLIIDLFFVVVASVLTAIVVEKLTSLRKS